MFDSCFFLRSMIKLLDVEVICTFEYLDNNQELNVE